jgi:hypothetical protein
MEYLSWVMRHRASARVNSQKYTLRSVTHAGKTIAYEKKSKRKANYYDEYVLPASPRSDSATSTSYISRIVSDVTRKIAKVVVVTSNAMRAPSIRALAMLRHTAQLTARSVALGDNPPENPQLARHKLHLSGLFPIDSLSIAFSDFASARRKTSQNPWLAKSHGFSALVAFAVAIGGGSAFAGGASAEERVRNSCQRCRFLSKPASCRRSIAVLDR